MSKEQFKAYFLALLADKEFARIFDAIPKVDKSFQRPALYFHTQPRASQSLKPRTSPSKAMSEILNYNKQFQSHQMKQGFRDEKAIMKMYENKVGCQVKHMGLVISSTHPFLGASPDGETHGGLVEIKRIFVGADSSLTKALYKNEKRLFCEPASPSHFLRTSKDSRQNIQKKDTTP